MPRQRLGGPYPQPRAELIPHPEPPKGVPSILCRLPRARGPVQTDGEEQAKAGRTGPLDVYLSPTFAEKCSPPSPFLWAGARDRVPTRVGSSKTGLARLRWVLKINAPSFGQS